VGRDHEQNSTIDCKVIKNLEVGLLLPRGEDFNGGGGKALAGHVLEKDTEISARSAKTKLSLSVKRSGVHKSQK